MSKQFDMGCLVFPQPMTMDREGNFYHTGQHPDDICGMTLWEEYAGRAMKACIAGTIAHSGRWPAPEEVSKEAFLYADAMIAERKRRMEGGS